MQTQLDYARIQTTPEEVRFWLMDICKNHPHHRWIEEGHIYYKDCVKDENNVFIFKNIKYTLYKINKFFYIEKTKLNNN